MLKIKNTFLLLFATVFTASVYAQPTLLPAKPVVTNYMEILMIAVALLLVLVVWVLANVLMMVSKKAVEHAKSNPKIMMIFVVVMGSMFAKKGFAQTTAAISDSKSQGLDMATRWGPLAQSTSNRLFLAPPEPNMATRRWWPTVKRKKDQCSDVHCLP